LPWIQRQPLGWLSCMLARFLQRRIAKWQVPIIQTWWRSNLRGNQRRWRLGHEERD
jgi:hypothetical protein